MELHPASSARLGAPDSRDVIRVTSNKTQKRCRRYGEIEVVDVVVVDLPAVIPVDVQPIAVVGIGCRLPGDANTPDTLWDLLRSGGNTTSRSGLATAAKAVRDQVSSKLSKVGNGPKAATNSTAKKGSKG